MILSMIIIIPPSRKKKRTNEEKDPYQERADRTEQEETGRRRSLPSRIVSDKISYDYSYGLLS